MSAADPAKAAFVIAWAYGPGLKNWAMRSIGDSPLGNSRAYRNAFGPERKLIGEKERVEARLAFTRRNLLAKAKWEAVSDEDLVEIIRVQYEQLEALGAQIGERKVQPEQTKEMSRDELVEIALTQLRQILGLATGKVDN